MFLKNAWYVAGWSKDFTNELKAERYLDENIVFYRRQDGTPVALENACPHRKLPLSMGKIVNGNIECGYHGLTFDGAGKCVFAPTQPDSIPPKAKVKSYPVIDRYRLLWIWMGDPELAEPDKIFFVENYDNPDWGYTDGGVLDIDCNYLWVADNLLDPSHVAWVHVTTFAGAGTEDQPLKVEKTPQGVIVHRWISGKMPSPYYAKLVKFKGPCDRLQHYEMCFPAIGVNKSVYTPVGTGGKGTSPIPETLINISYNFMTPISEKKTRYFWFQHRNTEPHNKEVSEQMNKGAYFAFEEDRDILVAVHEGMANKTTPNIDLGLDAGAKLFRRSLTKLIAEEQDKTN
ncbi:MAG: aromatic ring-hydroxylating dioxygenase subunit alpha [Rhodobacteraceae bacterium]|nr:aromatic ring-hydroxylating dioxygenase subunit alpha [Paracoccaceae bacterium]MCY4251622.1 aromatic ring-hydroxylating dioxygenase subunit alpha [Paracoccaceae bacterium]MCY4309632.1 aromatic ring-hydroxylating dioxygenase subunit alpha [Paracoccaceae bacterium]